MDRCGKIIQTQVARRHFPDAEEQDRRGARSRQARRQGPDRGQRRGRRRQRGTRQEHHHRHRLARAPAAGRGDRRQADHLGEGDLERQGTAEVDPDHRRGRDRRGVRDRLPGLWLRGDDRRVPAARGAARRRGDERRTGEAVHPARHQAADGDQGRQRRGQGRQGLPSSSLPRPAAKARRRRSKSIASCWPQASSPTAKTWAWTRSASRRTGVTSPPTSGCRRACPPSTRSAT